MIEQNPDNLYAHLIDEYLKHLSDTYRIAGETVDAVCSTYPWLVKYINREEVALAGGLHDIGRPLRKNQLFHELRGAKYIEDHGLEAELSNINGTKISVQDRLADIKKRYADDPLYNSNASLSRAMDKGLPRILKTCERVEKLKCGKLAEPEIMRYGFI